MLKLIIVIYDELTTSNRRLVNSEFQRYTITAFSGGGEAGHCGSDCVVVGFKTTCAISAYHH
jgi:hypothetical protein